MKLVRRQTGRRVVIYLWRGNLTSSAQRVIIGDSRLLTVNDQLIFTPMVKKFNALVVLEKCLKYLQFKSITSHFRPIRNLNFPKDVIYCFIYVHFICQIDFRKWTLARIILVNKIICDKPLENNLLKSKLLK